MWKCVKVFHMVYVYVLAFLRVHVKTISNFTKPWENSLLTTKIEISMLKTHTRRISNIPGVDMLNGRLLDQLWHETGCKRMLYFAWDVSLSPTASSFTLVRRDVTLTFLPMINQEVYCLRVLYHWLFFYGTRAPSLAGDKHVIEDAPDRIRNRSQLILAY
jgi:hypothetical protein